MTPDFQIIIVLLIVAAAALWLTRKFTGKKDASCGSCDSDCTKDNLTENTEKPVRPL